MAKYLVISYDNDEQQTFYDWVIAGTEGEAQVIIDSIRDYAITACGITPEELRTMADKLEAASEEDITLALHELAEDEGKIEEDETLTAWHKRADGSIWYGSDPEGGPLAE